MYKYSTPTLVFNTNVDLTDATLVELTIRDKAGHKVILNKERLTILPTSFEVTLLPSDLDHLYPGMVDMQVRYSVRECVPQPSNIMHTSLHDPLSGKELQNG